MTSFSIDDYNYYFHKRKDIDFSKINKLLTSFAKKIEKEKENLIRILTKYETFEVAEDEIDRSLDLLKNIKENKKFFKKIVGNIVSFLPRNQPLYALCCFGIIPATLSQKTTVRPPTLNKNLYKKLTQLLSTKDFFPSLQISFLERNKFLQKHTKTYTPKNQKAKRPITDVVIFTGSNNNCKNIRKQFSKNTLVITNGSGHNPIVITKTADLNSAIESILKVQLYNQGQDCASPSAILVEKNILKTFLKKFTPKVLKTPIGKTTNFENKVGPIAKINDLERIQKIFIENAKYISNSTPGIIDTKNKLVYPTIIKKPLKHGGNYTEQFAPIFFIQEYNQDKDLSNYFENFQYFPNAMYITIFGNSPYIDSLKTKKLSKKILHPSCTIIKNSNLHATGIERGFIEYGGYGSGASAISYKEKTTAKPTLPQRDIYETLIKPYEKISKTTIQNLKLKEKINKTENKKTKSNNLKNPNIISIQNLIAYGQIVQWDISKLEKLINQTYANIDKKLFLENVSKAKEWVKKYNLESIIKLEKEKNIKYFQSLSPENQNMILKLQKYLKNNPNVDIKTLKETLYNIPKKENQSKQKLINSQKTFFQSIYNLLLNKTQGPRLTTILLAANRNEIIKLLSF